MPLKIVSYNCQSFIANFSLISNLLAGQDVLLLQETFLNEHNCDSLSDLGTEYDFAFVPSTRKIDAFAGRSKGGLAIVWRKMNDVCCVPQYYNDRVMGLRLQFNQKTYLLLNVYLPCDYGNTNSLVEYKFQISELHNIALNEIYDDILIIGDFNCDPHKGRFFRELFKLVTDLSLVIRDIESLPSDSYSYVSRNNICSTSWLDHVVTSQTCTPRDFEIMYGLTFDDHIPLMFSLNIECEARIYKSEYSVCSERYIVDWSKVGIHNISEYRSHLDSLLDNYYCDAMSCTYGNCNISNHLKAIDDAYAYLVRSITSASKKFFPHFSVSNKKYKPIVGWNDECKDAHAAARAAFLLWHNGGKVRHGVLFDDMRKSRSKFRRVFKKCRADESKIKRQKFASAFRESGKKQFWKEVKRLNPTSHPPSIDGFCSESEISEQFKKKFEKVLADDTNRSNAVNSNCFESASMSRIMIDYKVVNDSIDRLKTGLGIDCLHSNHLKFSGKVLRNFSSRMFSAMVNHSYLPDAMLRGHIRPVVKDNKICKNLSNNYRPIMNSSMLLKTFEYALLPVLVKKLKICSLQFGFTPGSDCHSAILFAKETILSYTGSGSNVHCAAIDLSKAFDRVNFDVMLDKLCKTDLPDSVVRVIDYMMRNTYVNVCYGNYIGEKWKVLSGVRQGGILSPLLFNFYVDECIKEVSSLNVGCRLCYQAANIICYADDVLLLAPSGSGLRRLLDVFSHAVNDLRLLINAEKSKYIVFGGKCSSDNMGINSSVLSLKRVNSIKYLGVTLSADLSINSDIERVLDSFLKQFNGMYCKFGFVDFDTLCYLFKTYTTTFYGIGLWIEQRVVRRLIHNLSVAYHKAVKKVASLNVWDSNHDACERVGVDTMPHLIAKRLLSFYTSLRYSRCRMVNVLRYHLLYLSNLRQTIHMLFRDSYGVYDVSFNDYDALTARVDFIQMNEPRSHYVPVVSD